MIRCVECGTTEGVTTLYDRDLPDLSICLACWERRIKAWQLMGRSILKPVETPLRERLPRMKPVEQT